MEKTKVTYTESGKEETMYVDDFTMFGRHIKEKEKEPEEKQKDEQK